MSKIIDINYESFLNKKSKSNMHIALFADPKIKSIKIPILNPENPKDPVRPYRNLKCKLGKCLYDFKNLINLQKQSKKAKKNCFICKYCNEVISFDDFYEDLTLKKIISELKNDIKNNNKKYAEIFFKKIRLFRNGSWEPFVSEYNRLLKEKMYEDHLIGNKVRGIEGKNEGNFLKINCSNQKISIKIKEFIRMLNIIQIFLFYAIFFQC